MGKYIGPKSKIARKFGEAIYGADKVLEKRNYPPGQHGLARKRKKVSEYGTQLSEKQKAKYTYGLLEKQFSRTYEQAARMGGITGENLLKLLECRLDNVVYRLGFAKTRRDARQLVSHNHFTVNGKRVNIPSYQVKAGDVIEVVESSRSSVKFSKLTGEDAPMVTVPRWLEREKSSLKGVVAAMPAREDIDLPVEEHLIVELYSK